MPPEQMTLNGRYKLLDRLGMGGMSAVYKAQDLVLGRLVAVKLLHESLTGDTQFLRRFQQEAHAVANLTHPNIVTVHDIGQDGRRHYIVMEYVEGQTLKQIIRDQVREHGRPLPIDRALELAIQICAGIGYAHRAGLVHCDLKPQNVLVTRDERVKVADFGIARAISQATQADNDLVWGTPQYFSPEQAAGESATPASDVYAIGVVLFEMLSGRLPFEADNHTEMALKHIRVAPPPVGRLNPAVPKQLEDIVAKLLAKEPTGRYRTAGQLARLLSAYRDNSRQETGPVGPRPGHTVAVAPQTGRLEVRRPVERQTLFYDQPERPQPARGGVSRAPVAEGPTAIHIAAPEVETTDWAAVALSLLAIVALVGLIPLWYFVYQAWLPLG